MKHKFYNLKSDLLDYCIRKLDGKSSVALIVDKGLALQIADLYDEEDFEDTYDVNIQEDIYEYFITIVQDEIFYIEPAKDNSRYIEVKKLIILEDIYTADELYDVLDTIVAKKVVMVDYDVDDLQDEFEEEEFDENESSYCSCGEGNGCSRCEIEESLEENTENFYSDLAEIVEEILDELEDKCDCPECRRENIRDAILDVVDSVLKGFGIVEDREIED